jgi:hypothetical protein
MGAFVRVTYHKSYVVAQIEDFKQGIESYKLNQNETKWQILLRNKNKLKQFKLNMISDGVVSENEFQRMKHDNPDYCLSQDYLSKKLVEISEATKFQYDKESMMRLVNQQMYARIKAGNFKGLNLSGILITLQGELALAQTSLEELPTGAYSSELREKVKELKMLYNRIEEKLSQDSQGIANREKKMGANLKQ